MNAIFMNNKNSKTSDTHRLLINLTDKIILKGNDKYVSLSNLCMYYTWENVKKSYKNNKFKVSAPTWNEEFELADESYSISNIQHYLEYVFKKNMEKRLFIVRQKYMEIK